MEYFKLQIGCLIFVLYITFVYLRGTARRTGVRRSPHFMVLVLISVLNLILTVPRHIRSITLILFRAL